MKTNQSSLSALSRCAVGGNAGDKTNWRSFSFRCEFILSLA